VKVLIADDEPLARKRLLRLLNELEEVPTHVIEASNGFEAVNLCTENQPDIALLDIRMPIMDGLQAAIEINKKSDTRIIFITAYDEHALAAFDSNAIDYLLKPIKKERLQHAINKAQHYIPQPIKDAIAPLIEARTHVCSHSHNGDTLIKISDIICFKADQKYVCAYTTENSYLLSEPLKELEQEFDQHFIRVHRNALINIQHIHRLKKNAQGQHQLTLQHLDEKITVSRRHLPALRKLMQNI